MGSARGTATPSDQGAATGSICKTATHLEQDDATVSHCSTVVSLDQGAATGSASSAATGVLGALEERRCPEWNAEFWGLEIPGPIVVERAWYGLEGLAARQMDLTAEIQAEAEAAVAANRQLVIVKKQSWGDPAPFEPKELSVQFRRLQRQVSSEAPPEFTRNQPTFTPDGAISPDISRAILSQDRHLPPARPLSVWQGRRGAAMSVQAEFDAAIALVTKGQPTKGQASNDERLVLYGLFKQVKEGDCNEEQPWAVKVEKRAKWEAWNKVKGMSKEDAMKAYAEEVARHNKKYCLELPS